MRFSLVELELQWDDPPLFLRESYVSRFTLSTLVVIPRYFRVFYQEITFTLRSFFWKGTLIFRVHWGIPTYSQTVYFSQYLSLDPPLVELVPKP